MGYFSNGTEGRDYQDKYCNNCVHDVNMDCQLWLAHLTTKLLDENGETSDAGKVLNMLLPEAKDGLSNLQCRMFIKVEK